MFDRKAYEQRYYQEHKVEYFVRHRKQRQEGRYKEYEKEYSRCYREKHKGQLQHQRNQQRLEALSHYSLADYPICAHCDMADVDVLTIDHINNNGNKHRRELGWRGAGVYFYNYLKEGGYPSGYQVLCHNCNWKKRILALRS